MKMMSIMNHSECSTPRKHPNSKKNFIGCMHNYGDRVWYHLLPDAALNDTAGLQPDAPKAVAHESAQRTCQYRQHVGGNSVEVVC